MSTVVKLGPSNRGRPMTFEEFITADYETGYRYELIHGRLSVSPEANQPHAWVLKFVYDQLDAYAKKHPKVINHISFGARVFVPASDETTCPEPDIAVYRNFPVERGPRVEWDEVSPLLVVEIMGEGSEKDLERNPDLYLQVPTIEEYWVIDIRNDPARPELIAHRRVAGEWEMERRACGEIYRTGLLPGFELDIDPAPDGGRD